MDLQLISRRSAFRAWEQDIQEATFKAEQALRYALNSNWMLNCFPADPASEDLPSKQRPFLSHLQLPKFEGRSSICGRFISPSCCTPYSIF